MPTLKKENYVSVRSLRDSQVPGLNQTLLKVFFKDPGTKSERPPMLFRCAILMDGKKELDARKDWFTLKTVFYKRQN